MKLLSINKPGFLSLIIDQGRQLHQHMGLTPSGPMDEYAFLWANRLLDNDLNHCCIEISLGTFSASFLADTYFAITGADLNAQLNGTPLVTWQSYRAKKDDVLSFGTPKNQGIRAYLAIKGGIDCPAQFGSCCTVEREHIGGLHNNGEKLKKDDILFGDDSSKSIQLRSVKAALIPDYSNMITCHFICNSQWTWFDNQAQTLFCQQIYTILPNSNRMASKLEAKALRVPDKTLISEGVPLGAIQIPPNGQPIILLKDRQTIGGYPKLGNVISHDIEKLAQAMPGQKICFVPCSIEQAYQYRKQRQEFFT